MNANQWDAIRQLDENDSPFELAAAIGELLDEYDAARAELAAARPIVEAAKAWRDSVVNEETTGRTRAIADLIVAIDAARGKL